MIIHDCIQGTDKWHSLRSGIPTASEFSQLVTSSCKESISMKEYALTLAAEKYAGKVVDGFGGNKYTERGKELEDEARIDYEMINQVEVKEVGFITDNLIRYGCSPDSIIGDDGGLEIKCKIAKVHIGAIRYYKETGKTPNEYYAQPQGCMFITGRKWWDLRLYHPGLPGLTIRQYPDKEFYKVLRRQLKSIAFERDEIVKQLKLM